MKAQTYFLVTAVIFAVIAIGHVFRLINGWDFIVGSTSLPLSFSIFGVIIPGSLCIWGLRLGMK